MAENNRMGTTMPRPSGVWPPDPPIEKRTGIPMQRASGTGTGIADQPALTQPAGPLTATSTPDPQKRLTENGGPGQMGAAIPYTPKMLSVDARLRPETIAELKRRGGGR
jgi:hypothetical protein